VGALRGHGGELGGRHIAVVRGLQQKAASDALQVERVVRGRRGKLDLEHPHVLLLRNQRERILLVRRRDQYFDELRRDRFERGASTGG
jgi:hypothetical protein